MALPLEINRNYPKVRGSRKESVPTQSTGTGIRKYENKTAKSEDDNTICNSDCSSTRNVYN